MKKGVIKVNFFYPSVERKTFDIDYYCNKHIPGLGKKLGDSLKGGSMEKCLDVYFDNKEVFNEL